MGIHINGQDFGGSFDDIVNMAREFGERVKEMAPDMGPAFESCRGSGHADGFDRPNLYFYPPVNSYTARDGNLILEFALVGIDENSVSITFQGDFLVLSAKAAPRDDDGTDARFSIRGFKPHNIDRQKYRVSADDWAQEKAKAAFKGGVLTVTIPPVQVGGIKIEIVKEGD